MSDDGHSRASETSAETAMPTVEVMRHGQAWNDSALSDVSVMRAAQAALAQARFEMLGDGEIAVVLTDDEEMRTLNRTWRDRDEPTNVLAFPSGRAPGGAAVLGDVVIAYETALAEAGEAGIRLQDHVSHLVVHGVLHLLGFDHLEDRQAERMEDLERRALASLGIADPYSCGQHRRLAEIAG